MAVAWGASSVCHRNSCHLSSVLIPCLHSCPGWGIGSEANRSQEIGACADWIRLSVGLGLVGVNYHSSSASAPPFSPIPTRTQKTFTLPVGFYSSPAPLCGERQGRWGERTPPPRSLHLRPWGLHH